MSFFYVLAACAHTYYGPDCNLTCSTSCFNQTCDTISGECLEVTLLKSVIIFYDGIKSRNLNSYYNCNWFEYLKKPLAVIRLVHFLRIFIKMLKLMDRLHDMSKHFKIVKINRFLNCITYW